MDLNRYSYNKTLLTASRVCEILKSSEMNLIDIPKFESIDECTDFAFKMLLDGNAEALLPIIVKDWNDDVLSMDASEVADIVANFFMQLDKSLLKQITIILTEKKKQRDLVMSTMTEALQKQRSQIESIMSSLLEEMQSQINT